MSPQPQPILEPEEIKDEIEIICKDKKRNQIRRENLEQKLDKMIMSNNHSNVFNGYIGFALLATMVDEDISAMQNYMNQLSMYDKSAFFYSNYASFFFLFDKEEEAKEKLLLALDCPIISKTDFNRLASTAMYLKNDEIEEKILDKCKSFNKEKKYIIMQQELNYRKENIHKIEQMALFEENWNGNGGEKFTPEAIVYFKNIIQKLDKQPDIAPTGRNSLFIQYELNNNILAFEIAIDKTEKVYVPNEDYSHAQVEQFDTNVISKIQDSVKNFYEQE